MSEREENRRLRGIVAVAIGLAGAVGIWVVVPYVNYVIGLRNLSDSYLPAAAFLLILGLVLVVNPVLALASRRSGRWRLDFGQIALIAGIWLCASVVPGSGLLQYLPYSLADIARQASLEPQLAAVFAQMKLPPSLFPDEIRFHSPLSVIDPFITALLPGRKLPWGAWAPPLASWGVWLLFLWTMMSGLALVLMPQWIRNERLAFPLLTLQRSLIESPEPGRLWPPVFRKQSFWIGAAAVFLVQFLRGMNAYKPDSVPAIPLGWDLGRLFTEGILQHVHAGVTTGYVYFILVGMAFFMPSRISFSIWFFTLAYAVYIAIGKVYFPPFASGTIYEHRMGAMLAVSAGVAWLGRSHWLHVARCMIGRGVASDEDRRDRLGGYMLAVGCAGMFGWLVWARVQPGWAALYVAFGAMISMLMARVVAETGLPIIRFDLRYHIMLVKLAPISWLSAPTLFFSGVVAMFYASNMMFATMGMHAAGLDRDAGARRQGRFLAAIIAVLLLGVVVSGAAHLYCAYRYPATLDGAMQPINPRGRRLLETARTDLVAYKHGEINRPVHNQWKHLALGAGLAGALQWACITMPRWPLHPIGLILVKSAYADGAWPSLFIGWLFKLTILRYGGSRLFRSAAPLVLGTMAGELFAVLFWCVVPTVLALCGKPYTVVNILPPP